MSRNAADEDGLREAPMLPGLAGPLEGGSAGPSSVIPLPVHPAAKPEARNAPAALDSAAAAAAATMASAPKLSAPDSSAPKPSTRKPAASKAEETPDHLNHRQRLRDRFMQGGADAMPDYELLELVLFRAIPRRDVKPLAKRLLARFGDFNGVISAPPARLTEISGVGDAVVQELKIVEAAAHRLARSRVIGKNAIQTWDQLVAYVRARMAHEPTEVFRILFLDRKNVLIADEAQGRGTVDHVPVYPREVVKRALELEASALILVHNHPWGDPSPSRADIDMTRRIIEACRPMALAVHDHVIVGKDRVASFHEMGLLDD